MAENFQRRRFLVATSALLAWRIASAQHPPGIRRIGFLDPGTPTTARAGWIQKTIPKTLQKYGFEQGRNLAIEVRFAEGRRERLTSLVGELLHHKVDLIVTIDNDAALAVKQAGKGIPVVMASSLLPVEFGLISSYARPGGNITGFDWAPTPELFQKRYQLLKLAVPQAKRVVNVRTRQIHDNVHDERLWGEDFLRRVTSNTGLVVSRVEIRQPEDLAEALRRIADRAPDALSVSVDAIYLREIAEFAAKRKLVSIGGNSYAAQGGLLTHGVHIPTITERIASHISKVLAGTKPADLPVELVTRYELVLNMKVANAMGVKLPPLLMAQVDRVIE